MHRDVELLEYLIRRTYPVQAGESVLFHAAAGGAGLIACQWLKALGATVIGTVGSEEKAAVARAHGCEHVIISTKENIARRVREIIGRSGVPVVYGSIRGGTLLSSLNDLQPLGLLLDIGHQPSSNACSRSSVAVESVILEAHMHGEDDVEDLLKLRKDLDSRLRETATVRMALDKSADPNEKAELADRYKVYLSRVAAQYAPHSPIVMALAASRCMTTHPELAKYLLHHAQDEQGHDAWAIQDLTSLGLSPQEIRTARAVPSCEAMIGYTYFIAGHANPVGLFGWMYILEAVGDDLGREAAQGIRQKLGLVEDGVRFVAGHGEADRAHIKELEDQITRNATGAQDRADILRVAEVSATLYLRMFQEVDSGT